MRYIRLGAEYYAARRKRVLDSMPEGALLLLTGNDLLPSNADGTFGFIQSTSFFYLTGIDQEEGFLLLQKGGEEILFLTETSAHIRIWEGDKLSKEQGVEVSGIKRVEWLEAFWDVLAEKLGKELYVYRDEIQMERFPSFRSRAEWVLSTLKEKHPDVVVLNPAPFIHALRMVKDSGEIEAIKTAIESTHEGLKRAASFLKPGVFEFEVEAEITHEFLRRRSRFHAFPPIVASGANACVLHYVGNHAQCKDGDLLLLDFGAEYGNYRADMTRVLPVNGKFSARQAEVYSAVLRMFKRLREQMVVGNTVIQLKAEAMRLLREELVVLGLTKPGAGPAAAQAYLPHGVSHSLGLDVHDVGEKGTLFAPGMVFTLEPGIYIREEGIGIRLENDILITESGPVDLMAHVPIEMEDIENLMI
jgi:Xaa-Pro aminopeptidase